ncbi:Uncharacterised protein [Mycobacteroides abscessus subsp. abscessus]|uniref:hypothetical protein n=1 Tax=Mycobacteroides abscessus TaxID=36809 RepID=UPI0005DC3E09|nr:hypothetical protein [Mycobacteroides abscessus]MBL3752858.1 hypothetical protein [Mycobacteroides abscessus subsp. massiliense]MDM2351319.1 hypothetical protein [Mycobacteroides abscessus]MDM2361437.1 hypothetical protein [Mycobacteroides abscessus]QSN52515.1 hypothetical protein I3U39_01580 [Mycobacteroides abscessus subsp. abscessus]RIR61349.1 hypothetical protein D2E62_23365 [Mycobacteroides abscessus]
MVEGSGLNGNELYLNNNAGERVAGEFDKMADQLEDLKNQVMGWSTDLGMGACREGETWNTEFEQITRGPDGSIVAAIDGILEWVHQSARQARAAQKEFNETEHRSADSYKRLDPRNAYPPIPGGSS